MSFDFFSQDERLREDEEQSAQKPLGQQSPVTSGAPAQTQGPEQPGGTASGSFTNLQRYLDANESLKFGQQVAGRVGQDVDKAVQGQQQADSQFTQKVDQSTISEDPEVVAQIRNNPQALAADEAKKSAVFKMRDAQYQGPKNLVDESELYSQAYNPTNRATTVGTQVGNESGRKAYLDEQFGAKAGRYDYTGGQKKLDNYLIQNDEGSKDAFAAVGKRASDAGAGFESLKEKLAAYAGQGATKTAGARASTRGALGLADDGTFNKDADVYKIQQAAAERAAQLNKQRDSDYELLQKSLSSKKPDAEPLKKIGVNANQQLFKVDPTNARYLQKQRDASLHDAATPEEQARVEALSQLASQNNAFLPYADKAGKYRPEANFQTKDFLADADSARAAYNDALSAKNVGIASGQLGDEARFATIPDALKHFEGGIHPEMANYSNQRYNLLSYLDSLDDLRTTQEKHGFNSTLDGKTAEGSWTDYNTYQDLLPKYGLKMIPGTAKYYEDGKDPFRVLFPNART